MNDYLVAEDFNFCFINGFSCLSTIEGLRCEKVKKNSMKAVNELQNLFDEIENNFDEMGNDYDENDEEPYEDKMSDPLEESTKEDSFDSGVENTTLSDVSLSKDSSFDVEYSEDITDFIDKAMEDVENWVKADLEKDREDEIFPTKVTEKIDQFAFKNDLGDCHNLNRQGCLVKGG